MNLRDGRSRNYSIDVVFAYGQLGIDAGGHIQRIHEVLANATAYEFTTRARIAHVRRFVDFFVARERLGTIEYPFDKIRKSYYKQAMALHPDRNKDDKIAEEKLKIIIAAFEVVEQIHREAKDYFKRSEEMRLEIERQARETTELEIPTDVKKQTPQPTEEDREETTKPAQPRRARSHEMIYMAAGVPRYIRTARLGYLPLDCVIGSSATAAKDGSNAVFDIIMLPEKEFLRMKIYLATPDIGTPALQRGRLTPAYTPQDVGRIVVPEDEADPEDFARKYFIEKFKIEGRKR
jgi:hypothetical protein